MFGKIDKAWREHTKAFISSTRYQPVAFLLSSFRKSNTHTKTLQIDWCCLNSESLKLLLHTAIERLHEKLFNFQHISEIIYIFLILFNDLRVSEEFLTFLLPFYEQRIGLFFFPAHTFSGCFIHSRLILHCCI